MKSSEEWNREILKLSSHILDYYPELEEFLEEMTVTIHPDSEKPVDAQALQSYAHSLRDMLQSYVANSVKHIVIIGAGFAGLKLARKLNNHPNYRITLIDKNNYHQFQPLLYQVAMGNLEPNTISMPLRNIFQYSKNVRIQLAQVTNIDTESKSLETEQGIIPYDFLVIATGACTNYFGNNAIRENAFSMKSTLEALRIRNAFISHFEKAVNSEQAKKKLNLNVVIVGGGPTGVELSGALAEMRKDTFAPSYPELNMAEMEIYLLEGTGKLLSSMQQVSSQKALEYLQDMGVKVRLNTFVKDYTGTEVLLQDGSVIESAFVIWVAGVHGNFPDGLDARLVTKTKQLKTDAFNRLDGSKHIFVLGDVAYMESDLYPKGLPQLASVAIAQAENLASNFKAICRIESMQPFQFKEKGNMATVGKNKAVLDIHKPPLSFHGFFAWFIWMSLHLFLLIGFKNRSMVFLNWAYKYFTQRQLLSIYFPLLDSKQKQNG